jgi:hypothetical protein
LPPHHPTIQQKGEHPMAKVYRNAVFEVKLKPRVTGEQLEKFWCEELREPLKTEAWELMLLKKTLGSRGHDYLHVFVIDNAVSIPEATAVYDRWKEEHAELIAKWGELQEPLGEGGSIYIADYMEVK